MTPSTAMAHLSDTLFATAIATYAFAMIGYAAEYAFGRRGQRATALRATATTRTRVAVGGPHDTALQPARPEPPAPPSPKDRGSAPERIGRLSVAVTALGALLNAASVAVRAIAVDAVPWSNMYEFASVAGLVGVIAFTAVMWKAPQLRRLGAFVLLPVIALMFLAGTVLYSRAAPLVPALQSYWLAIHVVLVAIAEGALMTSAVFTVLFLVKQRHERHYDQPGRRMNSVMTFTARLPAAATLDKAAYRIVAFAFPLYTIAIICGAIWAEAAWGRYWGWDPKETWAFIVWVVFAAYLHARATAGWKRRAAAWINLAGFGAITFNFLIVNVVISGLHSYAGLS